MNTIYNHLSWFYFVFRLFLSSLLLSVYSSFLKISFHVSFPIFRLWFFNLDFGLFLDFYSLWFSTAILLISSVIIVYSFFYMVPYFKSSYFLWTTFMFIVSMLFVVVISNLFYIMLGWDGLGVVSFFLIVFYQNSSSINSGIFTLLINRIGDGFYLMSICFIVFLSPDFFTGYSVLDSSFLLPLFLVATFITKRAIFPFSSWLPMAIAAPTPISALVHSSTLVTSGLYLIIRYSYIIYSSILLTKILVVLCLFTSFYAGLNTIFEIDLKKLIALSTLSHLGFIGFSYASGLLLFSFFHLLCHALFKSLLFITIGDIIIALNHSQDIRYLSSGYAYTPFSVTTIYVSLLNLLGIPNISGYFSKDLVLEMFSYRNFSYSLTLVLYCNVFFTYFYTYQLFYYSYSSCKVSPFQIFNSPSSFHSFLMLALGLVSVLFGKFFLDFISSASLFVCIPSELKFIPLTLNIFCFVFLFIYISFPSSNSSLSSFYFSSMLFLTPVLIRVSSFSYFKFCFIVVKDIELGLLNKFIHSTLSSIIYSVGSSSFYLYRFNYLFLACLIIFSIFSIFI